MINAKSKKENPILGHRKHQRKFKDFEKSDPEVDAHGNAHFNAHSNAHGNAHGCADV